MIDAIKLKMFNCSNVGAQFCSHCQRWACLERFVNHCICAYCFLNSKPEAMSSSLGRICGCFVLSYFLEMVLLCLKYVSGKANFKKLLPSCFYEFPNQCWWHLITVPDQPHQVIT